MRLSNIGCTAVSALSLLLHSDLLLHSSCNTSPAPESLSPLPPSGHTRRASNVVGGGQHVYPECAREGGSLFGCFPDGNVPGAGQYPTGWLANSNPFDVTCNSNLVTFWGQNSYGAVNPSDTGNWQKTLAYYCQDDIIDAFPIAFVDEYFSTGGLPHIDLSSTCSVSSNGAFTGTNLANCSFLASNIRYCQSKGKLVTISLGGQNGASSFSGDAQAQQFADTIWNLFLGGSSTTRPFGDVFLDGVDLDIENGSSSYTAFVNRLRSHFTGASKKYYITATPQCPYPDAALSATLNSASFDAVQIQFYNNYCSLASYGTEGWNYAIWDYWARYVSPNKNVKLYIGGPAASGAAGSGYVSTAGLQTIVQDTWKNFPAFFGGVMFWDASQAYANGRYDKSTKATLKSGEVCTSKGQTVTYQKCTAAAWSSGGSYNGGSEVSYQGYQWSAKYWTADPPVGTDETNVWKALFACT